MGRDGILVGRAVELEALERVIEGGARRGQALLIEGEPGIGKTRLLEVAVGQARRLGLQVFSAAAEALASQRPFGVVADCLRIERRSKLPHRAELARLVVGRTPPAAAGLPYADEADVEFRAIEAILALVDDLCARGPILLAVDVRAALEALADIPMESWNYIAEGAGIRHLGPMAEDFWRAFGVGYGEGSITTLDAQGVVFAGTESGTSNAASTSAWTAETFESSTSTRVEDGQPASPSQAVGSEAGVGPEGQRWLFGAVLPADAEPKLVGMPGLLQAIPNGGDELGIAVGRDRDEDAQVPASRSTVGGEPRSAGYRRPGPVGKHRDGRYTHGVALRWVARRL